MAKNKKKIKKIKKTLRRLTIEISRMEMERDLLLNLFWYLCDEFESSGKELPKFIRLWWKKYKEWDTKENDPMINAIENIEEQPETDVIETEDGIQEK